jgi:hypothetical protein
MSYAEMIAKALKGRSVNAAAKQWGVPQKSLDTYAKGKRLPPFHLALLIADEAGIDRGEAFKMLADEELKLVPERGVEPPTSSLRMNCSTN